jgi:hypothetical protein
MSARDKALGYLARGLAADADLQERLGFGPGMLRDRSVTRNVITSKVYSPETSWTGRWSWWHQLSPEKIGGEGRVVLLCESRLRDGFHILRVPKAWLHENRDALSFSAAQGKFNLFLSAEWKDQFRECRGAGLDFTPWLVGT